MIELSTSVRIGMLLAHRLGFTVHRPIVTERQLSLSLGRDRKTHIQQQHNNTVQCGKSNDERRTSTMKMPRSEPSALSLTQARTLLLATTRRISNKRRRHKSCNGQQQQQHHHHHHAEQDTISAASVSFVVLVSTTLLVLMRSSNRIMMTVDAFSTRPTIPTTTLSLSLTSTARTTTASATATTAIASASSTTKLHLFGIGAMLSPPPKGLTTVVAGGEPQTLLDASEFFVDAFWTNKVGGGATELTAQQRRTLRGSQFNEFRQRYAGVRRGQSELILIQTRQQQQQLSPSPSSSSYSSRPTKGSPWPMTDNNIQRPEIVGCAGIQVSPIPDGNLDGPTIARAPLMANVAVSQKYRRRGIAQRIVKEVERICKYEWGYNDVYLYVEERNKAALRLYQKLGYRKVWTDDDAQTLLPTSNGRLENAPTRIVCMRKRLDLGLLGRFIPL